MSTEEADMAVCILLVWTYVVVCCLKEHHASGGEMFLKRLSKSNYNVNRIFSSIGPELILISIYAISLFTESEEETNLLRYRFD